MLKCVNEHAQKKLVRVTNSQLEPIKNENNNKILLKIKENTINNNLESKILQQQ